MELILFMTLPGLVITLTVLACADQLLLRAGRAGLLPWRSGERTGRVSATGFEMLHVSLLPGKEHELSQRQTTALLRDEAGDGAPRGSEVDLTAGTARIRLPG
ncbi:DUF6191 domain-containing protein [Streptomyces sp. XM4011]|uniref:DUF6191 domain-containing protein n=1 Tax=Streptomyces TaxID=1883 RepID=UPI001FF7D240|nr:DUF6191 domain-containing protein [Streptomyces sp. XM4011]MCK1815204.1 DUF6191 domain-containing protein [Streptomyces sp. XM4011]